MKWINMALPKHKIVPMIVACALLMQQMDSTALATALPSMSASLGVSAIRLHLAITSYLMALAIFLPMSGWVADRFGPRRVFCLAMGLFVCGSVLCGVAVNLASLVCARLLQGLGGAMMVPVGRLILMRSVEKSEILPAMVLMSMTSVIGPAMGPLLGGAITSFISWRWIFWINVPAGIVGVLLTLRFIDDVKRAAATKFDVWGFILTGTGFGCLMAGLDCVSEKLDRNGMAAGLGAAGVAVLVMYYFYAAKAEHPILDLRLFRLPTFRLSIAGGSLFRLGFGSTNFLLPLLMQAGLGFSPLQSGSITFIASAGSFGMKSLSQRILQRFGFRHVLIFNALITGGFLAAFGTFGPHTSRWFMMAIIFCGGFFRSLQMTSSNSMAFADVDSAQMRDATSMTQMAQRISQVAGVAIGALILGIASGHGNAIPVHAFTTAFYIVGGISTISLLAFWQLPETAGAALVGRSEG